MASKGFAHGKGKYYFIFLSKVYYGISKIFYLCINYPSVKIKEELWIAPNQKKENLIRLLVVL